jgi:hypothetical protein
MSITRVIQRPREEWIEIPVPALVTEESFARAQELLYQNKIRSRRRTIAPSVVQGLVSCAKCGYALSRTSTQTSARKIHYYKCIGSDSWRKLGGPVCRRPLGRPWSTRYRGDPSIAVKCGCQFRPEDVLWRASRRGVALLQALNLSGPEPSSV